MGLFNGRQSTLPHPSNRLYNGECVDFRDAARTYIAAMQYEHDLFTDEDDFNREGKELFARSIATAKELLAEYERTIGEAERALAARWAESSDDTTAAFGRGMIDGDYSPLAV